MKTQTETRTILTFWTDTETVADCLRHDGYKIVCICYGYQNFHDLIIFEVA